MSNAVGACKTRVKLYCSGAIELFAVGKSGVWPENVLAKTVMRLDGFHRDTRGWSAILAFTGTHTSSPLSIRLGCRQRIAFPRRLARLTVLVEDIDNANKLGRYAVLFVAGSDHRAWPHTTFRGEWLGYGRGLQPHVVEPPAVERLCGCTGRCNCI